MSCMKLSCYFWCFLFLFFLNQSSYTHNLWPIYRLVKHSHVGQILFDYSCLWKNRTLVFPWVKFLYKHYRCPRFLYGILTKIWRTLGQEFLVKVVSVALLYILCSMLFCCVKCQRIRFQIISLSFRHKRPNEQILSLFHVHLFSKSPKLYAFFLWIRFIVMLS